MSGLWGRVLGARKAGGRKARASLIAISKDKHCQSMDYLLKTEPSVYSFADLERDKTTVWDGVTNPVAVKNLREMKPGDGLVIYHTGDEKTAVGTASVVSVDVSDPKIPLVKIKVGKAAGSPKTLADVKAHTVICGLAAGAARTAVGGAADGGAVEVGGGVGSRLHCYWLQATGYWLLADLETSFFDGEAGFRPFFCHANFNISLSKRISRTVENVRCGGNTGGLL